MKTKFSLLALLLLGSNAIVFAQNNDNEIREMERLLTIYDETYIHESVDEIAQFPGGNKAFPKWFIEYYKGQSRAEEMGIEGSVIVDFVVKADGTVTNIDVKSSPDPYIAREVKRVFELYPKPKWRPARLANRPVSSRLRLQLRISNQYITIYLPTTDLSSSRETSPTSNSETEQTTEMTTDSSSSRETSPTSNSETEQTTEMTTVPIPLKMLSPHTPAEDGWTLSLTTKIADNISREDYIKEVDDDELHLYCYKRDDGSFIVSKETIDLSKFIKGDHPYVFGEEYSWTDKSGALLLKQGNITQCKYPNGNVTLGFNGKTYLYLHDNLNTGYVYIDENSDYFVEKIHGNEIMHFWGGINCSGFLIGDRFCEFSMGNLEPIYQKINGKYYWACPTDTIIDVKFISKDTIFNNNNGSKVVKTLKMNEFTYKNGDYYKIGRIIGSDNGEGELYRVGSLHRKRGILRFLKNGEVSYRLNDGSKFVYSSTVGEGILLSEDPEFDNGVLITADGKQERYDGGISETERKKQNEKENKEWAAKKKAEEEAKRQPYIKKYGYYPGDFKDVHDLIKPGRKFGAIKEYFDPSLLRTDGTSERYKVLYNTMLDIKFYAYVWVEKGIITDVSFSKER